MSISVYEVLFVQCYIVCTIILVTHGTSLEFRFDLRGMAMYVVLLSIQESIASLYLGFETVPK